jgi:hypothetical protein
MIGAASALAIVVFMFLIDLAAPMMFSVFRVDKEWSPGKSRSMRSRYKTISFPRSIFLLAFVASIIFSPAGGENNPVYMAAFVALGFGWTICMIIDIKNAYDAAK